MERRDCIKQRFIHDALERAIEKYDIRIRQFEEGGSYYDISDPNKKQKGEEWYIEGGKYESVMFVEAVPGSNLKKRS